MAQPPDAMSYQAVARDAAGDAFANTNISIRVSILEDDVNGTVAYSEEHSPTTDETGLFSLELGRGSIVSGTFDGIEWNDHDHFLKLEMDPSGGTTYTDMGTSQLLSVPYALFSGESARDDEQDLILQGVQDLMNAQFECGDPFLDARDGEVYETTLVGGQCWTAEGLRYAAPGSYASTAPPLTHVDLVGRYYDWAEAMDIDDMYNSQEYNPTEPVQGVCPTGWHLPAAIEVDAMLSALTSEGVLPADLLPGGSTGLDFYMSGRYTIGGFGTTVGEWTNVRTSTEFGTIGDDVNDMVVPPSGSATYYSRPKYVKVHVRCIKD